MASDWVDVVTIAHIQLATFLSPVTSSREEASEGSTNIITFYNAMNSHFNEKPCA